MTATLSEIIAKRQAMWPDATNVEARQALMGAPAVPATPTPVSPTLSVNQQQRADNIASRQANPIAPVTTPTPATPVTPVPMVQAPIDSTTGLSAPIQSTPATITPAPTEVKPVAPVTPKTPVKTEPVIDYNVSTGREAEIQKNVTDITTANPALLKDRTAYNQAFGYDTADQGKKAMLDSSFQGANAPVLMNQKDIVTALLGGQSVPVQKTQAYNNALVIADQFKKYNGMTDVQLLDNLKQGQIGTELDSLLSQNPNYAKAKAELAKAQKTASINRATAMATGVISGKDTPVVDDLKWIEAKYSAPIGANEQAYLSYVTQNPDVVSAATQVKQLSNQISTLTTTYNDALKSLKAQYGDMPASALLTLMGSRTNDTKTLLDSYINAKELAKGDFDLAMKMAEGHYNATSKDIAEQQQIAGEQRQVQAQKDMLQYKSDFEKQQAQEALNDPQTQIEATMQEFAKMGITAQGNTASKIAEFKASGKSLPEYISGLRAQFMSKPEYQQILDKKAGEGVSYQTIGDSVYRQNADGSLTKTNISATKSDATPTIQRIGGTNENPTYWYFKDGKLVPVNSFVSSGNAPTPTSAKYLDIATGTDVWVQCGTFARQLCGLDATPGWNSLEARQKAFSDTTPTAGGMILFTGSGYDKTYGHISSIESVNQDGTLNIVESNLKWDNKVTRRTIQANDPAISGFYNNTPLAKSVSGAGTQDSGTQYTDEQVNNLAYLVDLQEKNPSQAAKDMKEMGYTANDMANFKAGNVPLTEKQKNSSVEVMNAIRDLADPSKYEWNDAVGFLAGTPSWSGWDAANAEMAINNLVAKLTLPNLGVLKWPMSDKDILFIKEASSKLSRTQSDASFERNLIDAYNLSARRSGMPEITKLSDISGGTPQQTAGGEMDYTQFFVKK
jgi:hypothetical protein